MKFFLNSKFIIYSFLLISFLSSLRNLMFPLVGDELQYAEIGKNIIIKGEYSLYGIPSTFTPSLPFLVALFYSKSFPVIGYTMVKLVNLLLMIIGLRFAYLFFKKINLSSTVSLLIVLLTATNNVFVNWATTIYPEAILFCCLWVFLYYIIDKIQSPKQVFYFLIPFVLLMMTRYLYGVFIIIIGYYILNYFIDRYQKKDFKSIYQVLLISMVCMLPLLLWFKYVFLVEKDLYVDQSYFTRFKNNDLFYNIKAGLGLVKHDEVGKINGIPAFVSLFVPVTGFRNWIVSILLIASFCFGFITNWKSKEIKLLFIAIALVMLGLIIAGTGFSRYWLVLLPGFWVGFYLLFNYFKIKDSYFEKCALLLSMIYIANELRLDLLIYNKL
jgi:hypothetical protein